jgi:hypothetical protein
VSECYIYPRECNDLFIPITYTVTLKNGTSIPKFIVFSKSRMKFNIYSNDTMMEDTYEIILKASNEFFGISE